MIATKVQNKLHELIRYQDMFTGLVSREVRARYRGSALGFLWSLLNPLLMMAIYSLIFAVYMRINIPNYALFVFCSLLAWSWFSTSLQNATAAIASNASLIKKVYFPLEILPLVNVTTNLINYFFSLPVMFAFMLFSGIHPTLNILYFPILIAIQFLLTLGIALILCTLNAFFRDVEQLISPLLMVWFYITPIVYPPSAIPERFQVLLLVNPMAPLIAGYQNIFFYGKPPSWELLLYSFGVGVLTFAIGYAIFYRNKFTFSEVV